MLIFSTSHTLQNGRGNNYVILVIHQGLMNHNNGFNH